MSCVCSLRGSRELETASGAARLLTKEKCSDIQATLHVEMPDERRDKDRALSLQVCWPSLLPAYLNSKLIICGKYILCACTNSVRMNLHKTLIHFSVPRLIPILSLRLSNEATDSLHKGSPHHDGLSHSVLLQSLSLL